MGRSVEFWLCIQQRKRCRLPILTRVVHVVPIVRSVSRHLCSRQATGWKHSICGDTRLVIRDRGPSPSSIVRTDAAIRGRTVTIPKVGSLRFYLPYIYLT